MTVLIQIYYIAIDSDSKVLQQGEFPLKSRKPEQVAYDFWRQIKRNAGVEVKIRKVICEDKDITELVKEIEKKDCFKG